MYKHLYQLSLLSCPITFPAIHAVIFNHSVKWKSIGWDELNFVIICISSTLCVLWKTLWMIVFFCSCCHHVQRHKMWDENKMTHFILVDNKDCSLAFFCFCVHNSITGLLVIFLLSLSSKKTVVFESKYESKNSV